ncbi:two-component response regulator 24-like [Alnus glutinosa]|uniref:two-component response regulator 24-like n=1 Tax=Alnus glutinosa TaxID=3517 RepID=UPI002D786B2A|nr:two-component response regulator 24-like [Alnus glutinosa]
MALLASAPFHLTADGGCTTRSQSLRLSSLASQYFQALLLDALGIQNHVVGNGKEAVDVHSSGKSFDLILMDMDMPVMNGIEATRKLRAMGIRSLIAGVSACTEEQEKQEFIEAGLDDYQEKPLSATKLASILHKLKNDG